MDYQSDKKRFYIFLDAHNALNDIKYFNIIKRKGSNTFYDEVINPHSMEIFNTFLKQLGRYYNVEMVLTPTDAEYTEHLLYQYDMFWDIIHTTDYLFSEEKDKSKAIEDYLTMFKKDKDVSKINNYIIFDNNKIELHPALKNHLVDINPKTKPLSEESINRTLTNIGLPHLNITKDNGHSM